MLDEPLGAVELRTLLRAALQTGQIRFTRHAYEEMANDGLVEQDVRNVLWAGRFDGCDYEKRSWRYRVRTARIVVVVALRSEQVVVVVTGWKE